MRRATTLVEAVVFSAIALMVVAALFVVYRDSQREMARTSVHLRGVQAVSALVERLRLDLRAATGFEAVDGRHGAQVVDGAVLELWRHQPDLATAQALPPDGPGGLSFFRLVQVRYAYDARSRRLTRQETGGRAEPLPARYRTLAFQRAGDLLEVMLEWVPEELLDRAAADQGEVLAARLVLGLEGEARAAQHPGRIVNPTSLFQPAAIGAPASGGTR